MPSDSTAAPSTARDYLAHGWHLVPIPLGSKGPKGKGWQLRENCISDPARAGHLDDMNIGLAHLYAGTCALDVDSADLALPYFTAIGIDLTALVTAADSVRLLSGREGRGKLLYRLPEGVPWLPTIQRASDGFELRCATKDGKATVQDVLPPSIHPTTGKPYTWRGDWRALPVLPAPLLAFWQSLASQPRAAAPAANDGGAAEGGRNNFLTSKAGVMRRSGMHADEIEAALLVENAQHCTPPLDDNEVRTIARSVANYAPAPAGVADAEAAVAALAAVTPLEYGLRRKAEAKRLGLDVGTLDAAVRAARPAKADDALASVFPEVEPWAETVDGAALLADMEAVFLEYMTLPLHAAATLALWTLWTYVFDARDTAPILFASSPTPSCGKSTCMTLVNRMACRPLMVSSMSAATVFRIIEDWRPTLLIDEADSFAKDDEELRGVLNSGHAREGARVLRVEGDGGDRRVTAFSTWAPKMLAAIGSLPGTIESRAIIVRLQRRLVSASAARLGRRQFADIRARATRWAADNSGTLAAFDCELPEWLGDRAFDSWLPLFAVADAAGGTWPQQALAAACELSGTGAIDPVAAGGTGVELLRDIREVFAEVSGKDGDAKLPTADLIHRLCADEGARWCEYFRGQRITPSQVARLLKPFGIASKGIRMADGTTPKGYRLAQFGDAFLRYLPPRGAEGVSEPPHRNNSTTTELAAVFTAATDPIVLRQGLPPQANNDVGCGVVAAARPPTAAETVKTTLADLFG